MVKKSQDEMKKYQGKTPIADERYFKMDACMQNNGMHAQEFAKSLTAGLDKAAFPVRQKADSLQD